MIPVPRYRIYILTREGEKIFAFTWRGADIIRGMKRAEREAACFGHQVREVSYIKL